MAEKTTYSCDVCGIEKRDSNHWWKAVEEPADGVKFYRWNFKLSSAVPVMHLCGPGCATKKLARFMGADSIDPVEALSKLPQYPDLDRKVAAHRQEMESQQPQWTSDFLKGE